MRRNRVVGSLCLVLGVVGTAVVLFTDMTYWLLAVGGPYFGMAVGTAMVALAFIGFALVLPRGQQEGSTREPR